MQPYFFPYLGYLDLINCSDRWIVFDTVQYIRHGWINRNRVLHPIEGSQYIIVPLKKRKKEEKIVNVTIDNSQNWQGKLIGQLQHYKKHAKYFDETISLLETCISIKESSISKLNVLILEKVCCHLDISFNYEFLSEMNLEIEDVKEPGDWALKVSHAVGAEKYINPPGGKELFDKRKFQELGIKLVIREMPSYKYNCRKYEYHNNLSIIDLLMWNSVEQIKKYLDEQKDKFLLME